MNREFVVLEAINPRVGRLRLGEQPVQRRMMLPVVSADPAREALLAFPLEADHAGDVRPVVRG